MSGDCANQNRATGGNWGIPITAPLPMTDHWGPIQEPIHSKKKKRKRWAETVLFKIVPQAAIEALQSQHRSQWQTIGIQISEKKREKTWCCMKEKESWRLIETRAMFNFNHTSPFMHVDGCDDINRTLNLEQWRGRDRHDGRRKFHLNTVCIMRQMQIISYSNIFQIMIQAECIACIAIRHEFLLFT